MSRAASGLAVVFAVTLGLAGCSRHADPGADAIARARAAHGSDRLERATVRFSFRGDRYTAEREGGRFRYVREYADSTGAPVRDVLTNEGLTREVSGAPVSLPEREARSAETTVNSVVYFALLPFNLADPAVRPRHLGADTVRGAPYDVVEVTFAQEGGGRDWEDRFVYWIHADRSTMDYLAYTFHTGEGGTRFREAIRPREVGGVRFADYLNYSADPAPVRLEDYPRLFEAGQLQEVSAVRLENVEVD